jgi:succinate dehydrogenase / fumarate reductase cytochrome b subunit
MSTTPIGQVRHPKGVVEWPAEQRGLVWLWSVLDSSVGAKVVVALGGVGLAGFAVFHMLGNLKIFQGPDALNSYAHFLKHDLGALLWLARGGLLTIFLLHVVLALRLKRRTAAARPHPYGYPGRVHARVAARTMAATGIITGLFILFHLAHFTFGWVHQVPHNGQWASYLELKDAQGRHDVYAMVIAGFRTTWIAALYLVAQVALCVHLIHGIPSAFQTFGLHNRRSQTAIRGLGILTAGVILIGNVLIVLAVWSGWIPSN